MRAQRMFRGMTHRMTSLAIVAAFVFTAGTASAACTAEYKAKQDNPLRLEHGNMEVAGPCTVEDATQELTKRLAEKGWTLLKVLTVSGS